MTPTDPNAADRRDDDGPASGVVLYVDGGLSPAEAIEFERGLALSPEMQRAVDRARLLRSLIEGLPRHRSPVRVETILARLAPDEARAPAVESIERALRSLPRSSAPAGLFDRILAQVHAERAEPAPVAAAAVVVAVAAVPPKLRLLRPAVAAAALLALSLGMYSLARPRPSFKAMPQRIQFTMSSSASIDAALPQAFDHRGVLR